MRKNKIHMIHPGKEHPGNVLILHAPHPGSYYRQDQVREYLSNAGITMQHAQEAL